MKISIQIWGLVLVIHVVYKIPTRWQTRLNVKSKRYADARPPPQKKDSEFHTFIKLIPRTPVNNVIYEDKLTWAHFLYVCVKFNEMALSKSKRFPAPTTTEFLSTLLNERQTIPLTLGSALMLLLSCSICVFNSRVLDSAPHPREAIIKHIFNVYKSSNEGMVSQAIAYNVSMP